MSIGHWVEATPALPAETLLAAAGVGHAAEIPTFTKPHELEGLLRLAQAVPAGGTVLEIGSYLGASTCYLAAGLWGRGGRIVCVDTWRNETMPEGLDDTWATFERNTSAVAGMLETRRQRSSELSNAGLERGVDLAFLDGDHGYRVTRGDFDLVEPLVAEGGVVAFHDARYFQGVSRVLGEVLATGDWRLEGCCENLSWVRRAGFANMDREGLDADAM